MVNCPICGKSYKFEKRLYSHMRAEHGIEKPYQYLNSHENTQENIKTVKVDTPKPTTTYKCGNCGFLFTQKFETCPKCGAIFVWE